MLCDEQHTWVICNWSYWLLTRSVLPSFWEHESFLRLNFLTCLCTSVGVHWIVMTGKTCANLESYSVMNSTHGWFATEATGFWRDPCCLPSVNTSSSYIKHYKTIIIILNLFTTCCTVLPASVRQLPWLAQALQMRSLIIHLHQLHCQEQEQLCVRRMTQPLIHREPSIVWTVMNMYELQYPSISFNV